jgi:hypothetical protein
MTTDALVPAGESLLYQAEDGHARIECRFEEQTLWLTQMQMAEPSQSSVPNINIHLNAIYAEGEPNSSTEAEEGEGQVTGVPFLRRLVGAED